MRLASAGQMLILLVIYYYLAWGREVVAASDWKGIVLDIMFGIGMIGWIVGYHIWSKEEKKDSE